MWPFARMHIHVNMYIDTPTLTHTQEIQTEARPAAGASVDERWGDQ